MTVPQTTDPSTWVERYGDYLYRYALFRLRSPVAAEELVQEAFLAALKARRTFSGRSSEKTWLVGILKHKIADRFRQMARELTQDKGDGSTDAFDALFNRRGHWKKGPAGWAADPRDLFEKKEFWRIFYACLNALPPRIGVIFFLRELEGMSSESICRLLGITPENLWVILHRAREGLRRCLEEKWFCKTTGEAR